MEKIELFLRRTRRYNDGWAHLDEQEPIGTARHLSSKQTKKDADGCTTLSLFMVSSSASADDIESALYDTLTSACRCEHDCCGHMQSRVSRIRRLGKGSLFAVRISNYRNI